jgi:hypothetical protein
MGDLAGSRSRVARRLRAALVISAWGLVAAVAPASAQWTRVTAIPATDIYAVAVTGDTVIAGADTVAWVSTDGGASWRRSAPVGAFATTLESVLMRDRRLWVGTSGRGVFSSDDLGATWTAREDGLTGGVLESHRYVLDLAVRGESLYAATGGAGVYVRPLRTPGPWQPTGPELVANQAGGIEDLAVHGTRMLAAGGYNGQVFRNDGGAPWFEMTLANGVLLPNVGPTAVTWTGTAWLAGTDQGIYRSPDGAGPWTFVGFAPGGEFDCRFATDGRRVFACVNRTAGADLRWTRDDGTTWRAIELSPIWVYDMAMGGAGLWVGRGDGLWRRGVQTLEVTPVAPRPLAFTRRGPHPLTADRARFGLTLERAAALRLELLDVGGRRVRSLTRDLPAGEHELAVDMGDLPAGVYQARVSDGERVASLRVVRLGAAAR